MPKIIIIILSIIFLSACSSDSIKEQNIDLNQAKQPTPTMTQNLIPTTSVNNQDSIISIKTKDGEIVAKLYSKEAPNTVANFIKKANSGFYKNLNFHRVIPGFMAQGGDPTGTGTGGGDQKSEINNIPFVRGSFGLARAGNKEISNDSQFFICFNNQGCQHLTGDYVNFGEVISGLDILDKIQQGDKIIDITTKTK
ncbi:MAG: peptidylprolyl isomerase [Candidatus Shapirobacteria bacterium]